MSTLIETQVQRLSLSDIYTILDDFTQFNPSCMKVLCTNWEFCHGAIEKLRTDFPDHAQMYKDSPAVLRISLYHLVMSNMTKVANLQQLYDFVEHKNVTEITGKLYSLGTAAKLTLLEFIKSPSQEKMLGLFVSRAILQILNMEDVALTGLLYKAMESNVMNYSNKLTIRPPSSTLDWSNLLPAHIVDAHVIP